MPVLMQILKSSISDTPYDCLKVNDEFRKLRDDWMLNSPNTPFTPGDLAEFKGLYYYPIDCTKVRQGILSLNPHPVKVKVSTTGGGTVDLIDFGLVNCQVDGTNYDFILYKNISMPEFAQYAEAYFIPIKDTTSSAPIETTFAAGRYVKITLPPIGNPVIVDFNMVVNPFENYNNNYSSLLVAPQNMLFTAVQSGERKYEDRTD